MNECVVVIPTHKSFIDLTNDERKSISNTLHVFDERDVFLILPFSISEKEYLEFFGINILIKKVDDKNLKSESAYNTMLMCKDFYALFLNYRWMLICQTDAYVFKDNLKDFVWHDDYFFIGAPVMSSEVKGFENLIWVGNGGLSMRRVDICYEILKRLEFYRKFFKLFYLNSKSDNFFLKILRHLISKLLNLNFNVYFFRFLNFGLIHEDVFWCLWVPSIIKGYRPADIYQAIRFSFEMNPRELYSSLGHLPLGCHAWEKYDSKFWTNHINK